MKSTQRPGSGWGPAISRQVHTGETGMGSRGEVNAQGLPVARNCGAKPNAPPGQPRKGLSPLTGHKWAPGRQVQGAGEAAQGC